MELWDVYNEKREKTGKLVERGRNTLGDGEYHLVVLITIFSKDGRMLIQQRVDDKETWPSMWDISVGGAVTAGEDSRTGAERELFEELGIRHSLEGVRPAFTLNKRKVFCDCYTIVKDVDLDDLVLQPTEVQAAKYATIDEILEMIDAGTFIPYHESLLRLVYDLRENPEYSYKK